MTTEISTSKKLEIEVNNHILPIKVSGKGRPIILIHTWHGYAKHFSADFSDKYQIVTFDVPGYYSEKQKNPITTMDDLVETLDKLFDKLKYKEVDIIGVCLGGLIAMNYAASHPKRVGKLILVTMPFIYFKKELNRAVCKALSILVNKKLPSSAVSFLVRRQLIRNISDFFGGYKNLLSIFVDESELVSNYDFDKRVFFGILHEGFRSDLFELGSKIKAKTLFVSGQKDPVGNLGILKKLSAEMDGASYAIIPNAKHAIVNKKTEEFHRIASSFLTE